MIGPERSRLPINLVLGMYPVLCHQGVDMNPNLSDRGPVLAPSAVNHPDQDEFRNRIQYLSTLQDGWYDGIGLVPDPGGLSWLADCLTHSTVGRAPRPFLYPTAEGGIRCEWLFGRRDVSLEVGLREGDNSEPNADWHVLDLETDHEEAVRVVLNQEGWDWVGERLQALSESAS